MSNMELLKKLRENTGCGMSDCNKALKETNDDYEKAVEWLRKKGLSSAAKKSARITAEGLIGIHNTGSVATILEVNSETDFVARNDKFQELVVDLLKNSNDLIESDTFKFAELLKEKNHTSGSKVADVVANAVGTIGENIQIRRGKTLKVNKGLIVSYVHSSVGEGLGKIGVLVALESEAEKAKLEELGKGIAMHIAASKPEFLNESEVPASKIDSEKGIAKELAEKAGKPANIIEKMVEGRIKKYYEENVLLNQAFIMDNSKKISEILKDFEKENGKPVSIDSYVLFILGEGIEKQACDLASEVASIVEGK